MVSWIIANRQPTLTPNIVTIQRAKEELLKILGVQPEKLEGTICYSPTL